MLEVNATSVSEAHRIARFVRPLVLFALIAVSLPIEAKEERPNIVFIFSDDHAPHAIGAYDGWLKSVNPTPEIDQLAEQGMLFENSFCTNSICGPSRAVIQTGKHSHKNGFMDNGDRFDWNQQTFPKLLQGTGYQTAIFGKSHLKGKPQGYNEWAVLPGQGLYYNPDFYTKDGQITIQGHCTDVVTDMAVDFLENKRDTNKPFMLMVQHKAPHRNWMPAARHLTLYDDIDLPEPATLFDTWEDKAPPARHQETSIIDYMHLNYDLFVDLTPDFTQGKPSKSEDPSSWRNMQRMSEEQMRVWRDAYGPKDVAFHAANLSGKDLLRWKYQRYAKNYLRTIKGVDESVGRLVATLDELGLSDNTIVIYSSDQGFFIGDHGWYDKRWMYEESLKMPFIIKWPNVITPGSRQQKMIQNIDYAETFLDIAQAAIPDDMQGRSLLPLLKGESVNDWRDSIYYHYYEYPSVHMVPKHNGIRTERYKLMHFYEFGEWEFYDLENDPEELNNLYGKSEFAELIETHKAKLASLQEYYDDDSELPEMPEAWKLKMRP
ncbi:MAG: sulfatase [Opitutales bacterium]|jgi:arylsulfatase A-like enzyme|tara:strand:+ start:89 stop:1726 length:1638 start_codon:yes stop_codon:yes gene_type:complete